MFLFINTLFLIPFLCSIFSHKIIAQNNDDHYKKINGISEIVWINMDRSVERRAHMEEELSHISVPNRRFVAIDGTKDNLQQYFSIDNKNTYKLYTEIACTLSHLLVIASLKNVEGDHFLVLEDDVTFENMKILPFTLEEIIRDAPSFDILQIHRISGHKNDLYNKWIYDWSTAAYIISRQGIQKITEKIPFINDMFQYDMKNIVEADTFLFESVNTVTYKYNILQTTDEDSNIQNHMNSHRSNTQYHKELIISDFL